MDLIYNVALSTNGYDQFGHYLRTTLLAGCNSLATVVNPACTANFIAGASSARAFRRKPQHAARAHPARARTPTRCCACIDRQQARKAERQADAAAGRPAKPAAAAGPAADGRRPQQTQAGPAAAAAQGRPCRRLPARRRRMSRRRGATAIASNPVLVGVATTLVIVVAVFLAYNANAGLPWVPTYRLTAEVPGATSLVKGNEVRIGGLRVGVVDKITPVQQDDGVGDGEARPEARDPDQAAAGGLHDHGPAAVGAGAQVHRDHARRLRAGLPGGRHDPARERRPPQPVEFDEFFNMWDEPTRVGNQQNLRGFGDAFAGRGEDLNEAIQPFVPLVPNAVPVLTNIADPGDALRPLLRVPGARPRSSSRRSPCSRRAVGEPRPHDLAPSPTWRGPSSRTRSAKGPRGQETAIETFPQIRPFFRSDRRVLRRAAARRARAAQLCADARERVRARASRASRARPASTAA